MATPLFIYPDELKDFGSIEEFYFFEVLRESKIAGDFRFQQDGNGTMEESEAREWTECIPVEEIEENYHISAELQAKLRRKLVKAKRLRIKNVKINGIPELRYQLLAKQEDEPSDIDEILSKF